MKLQQEAFFDIHKPIHVSKNFSLNQKDIKSVEDIIKWMERYDLDEMSQEIERKIDVALSGATEHECFNLNLLVSMLK